MIDVSLRLGILALLKDLRERLGVSVLFITHDVATARYIGEDGELYVIHRGQVVERGPVEAIISGPVHPCTQSLLSAIPVLHGPEAPGGPPGSAAATWCDRRTAGTPASVRRVARPHRWKTMCT
ncbi:hypothetical protein [Planomonospora sp. ID67723]|uniref:hypothetical protein n=1 Tax=Planomonospora sp. ID67723 TaxID=2738134 RepID=UPI001E416024|nr:hypothetical protein [Planomonospora sp. ID67723]